MFEEPSPLPAGSLIGGFTPDASLSWVVAYAGPCGDPECVRDDPEGKDAHARLYMIPVIGWLHITTHGNFVLRPAIMAAGGAVTDYLQVAEHFRFIAILRQSDDTLEVAKALFHERYGADHEVVAETSTLSN